MHIVPDESKDSFEATVLKYENKLYRTALAILNNSSEAEDILQEVFIKYYMHSEPFQSSEHKKAWLIRVTINLCKNRLRSSWWKKSVPLLDIYPAEDPEEEQLMEHILSLPAKYRTVIHLYYYEGYSTKEIAALTDQKESTVRTLMARGRKQLKDILGKECYYYER